MPRPGHADNAGGNRRYGRPLGGVFKEIRSLLNREEEVL